MIRNLPDKWDIETDVVAIGSGIGGLSAAISAHDHGAKVVVLERSDQVGGVTAYSVGEVWIPGNHLAGELGIEDSVDSGFRYLKRLSMNFGSDVAILNLAVNARQALGYFEDRIGLKLAVIRGCPDYYYGRSNDAVAEGRLLEVQPFPAQSLGEWQSRTRVSPYALSGLTHEDMFGRGGPANVARWDYDTMADRMSRDERCLGPGLAAYFVKGVLDRDIPIHLGADAQELIEHDGRIVGLRAFIDGRDVYVKADRGVVIATSSYEKNQDLNRTLGQQLDPQSMVFATVDGANFRLAGPAGARIAKVPDITIGGFHIPGEEHEDGRLVWRTAMTVAGFPHSIVVNRKGKRFANEAFYRELFYAMEFIDGGSQSFLNFPCWVVIDSQAREKYPFGTVMPGQQWPEGFGVQADTLEELAAKTGIDAQGLSATVAGFNQHAQDGKDPEFGRGTSEWSAWMCGDPFHKPNPNLGTVEKGPFFAVELSRMGGSAIPATGLLTDHHSRVLGWDDRPIAGLYAAGNSVARMETGAAMQSGISNARGMTHGYLAGRHAAGDPSDVLAGEIERMGL